MLSKKLRIGSLMLALVMLAAMLAACNKSPSQATPTVTGAEATTATAASTAAPEPKKDLELTAWFTSGDDLPTQDPTGKNVVKDWLKQQSGVNIKQVYGNGGQNWGQKLNLLAASGDMPNIVINGNYEGSAQFKKLSENNLIWELTPEMIEKYMPKASKRIPKAMWDANAVDGKIYGIPTSVGASTSAGKLVDNNFTDEQVPYLGMIGNDEFSGVFYYVRDDILKKLYPDLPSMEELQKKLDADGKLTRDDFRIPVKSTEDWIKFLTDIKALNLKVGDKPVYPFGLNGSDNWLALSMFGAELVGYNNYNYLTFWNAANKTIDFGYLQPEIKQAGLIVNRMLRDKIIEPESLIHKGDQWNAKVMNGLYGMVINWAPVNDANALFKKENRGYQYRPITSSVPRLSKYPYENAPPAPDMTVGIMKTVKEEDLPQVLAYYDAMLSEEFEEVLFWGPKEAGLYEETADGKRVFKDPTWEKVLNQGDNSVKIDRNDLMGLRIGDSNSGYPMAIAYRPYNNDSKWSPNLLNKVKPKFPLEQYAYIYEPNDPHTVYKIVPPNAIWDAATFGAKKTVTDFWTKRAVWDDPFKIALTANSDAAFDEKWAAATKILKDNGIDQVLKDMTEVSNGLLPKIEASFGKQ
jgi:putative aldouronate transport system substrate-binding protein